MTKHANKTYNAVVLKKLLFFIILYRKKCLIMKITLVGSLNQINSLLIPKLIAAGHEINVATSTVKHTGAIEDAVATALVGDIQEEKFLLEAFQNTDVAYLMLPNFLEAADIFHQAEQQGASFRNALEQNNVKKIIALSSIGAEAGKEAGALYAYNLFEQQLRQIKDAAIAFVRPAALYNNLTTHLTSIIQKQAIFSNLPADLKQYWTSPLDVATEIFSLVQKFPAGHSVHYVASDSFTGEQLAQALQVALRLPRLHYVAISDEQAKENLLANRMSPATTDAFIEMNHYQRQAEKLYADFHQAEKNDGQIKLTDYIAEFANAYWQATKEKSLSPS